MDFLDRLGLVIGNVKFWTALWVFAQVLIRQFFPDFPPNVLDALNVFIGIVLSLFFVTDVGESRAFAKMQRQLDWGSDNENEDDKG